MSWKHGLVVAFAVTIAAMPATAQSPIRAERVHFARGASSATIRGSIKGYDTIDYIVGARAGQAMSVSLKTSNMSSYFNVLPPRSEEAIFNGSIAGSRFDGRLKDSGDYRIRVYLMRNAARRGERATYSLSVGVNARPGNVGAGPGPIGSGPPISAGNRPAYCRGEASQRYGVPPNYIRTRPAIANATGIMIDGTADQGRDGIKRFRCRFDARGRFIDVMAMTPDGF
ncbi:hypothetical protein PX699_02245 [Sphingobium sp. H39-3-25]|uniref:hypothetical protein n=1 Tax=Sphingobium arseniciresistens TaxID=3030834 RepID=UPI0023BA1FB6|nr:hypothetical protein [Sphingobium arseniciresistens]